MAHVLIVDDSEETARPLAMLLRLSRHEADCVASGGEALAYLQQQLPDVIVLDVMMPGMDGMEVLRQVRADPRTCAVSVMMFSAVSDPAYREAAMEKGADDYVIKGLEFDALRKRIEQWAGQPPYSPGA